MGNNDSNGIIHVYLDIIGKIKNLFLSKDAWKSIKNENNGSDHFLKNVLMPVLLLMVLVSIFSCIYSCLMTEVDDFFVQKSVKSIIVNVVQVFVTFFLSIRIATFFVNWKQAEPLVDNNIAAQILTYPICLVILGNTLRIFWANLWFAYYFALFGVVVMLWNAVEAYFSSSEDGRKIRCVVCFFLSILILMNFTNFLMSKIL